MIARLQLLFNSAGRTGIFIYIQGQDAAMAPATKRLNRVDPVTGSERLIYFNTRSTANHEIDYLQNFFRGFPALKKIKRIGTQDQENPLKLTLPADLAQAIDHIGFATSIEFQRIEPEFGIPGYCQFNHRNPVGFTDLW